jgi:FtsP/CotA-like multicopper oxidase with cupredoxin domain
VALTVASVPDEPGAAETPPRARMLLAPGAGAAAPAVPRLELVDLLRYGTPAPDPLSGEADVTYPMVIRPASGPTAYTINAARYPHVPTMLVGEGQLVRIVVVNEDDTLHPIHLHGHTFAVVAQDGVAPQGSPLHLDTHQVPAGHSVVIAFRADNPGLWMLHCHNLAHAALGLDMMVDYVGITSPFEVDGMAGNHPE